MRRRDFIKGTAGSAAAWPAAARAQRPGNIGYLGSATRELGSIEDRTVAIEYRRAEGRTEIMAQRISLVTSTLYRPVRSDHRPVPPTLQVANSR